MIDIYGLGPYLHTSELIRGAMQETGVFFLHFLFVLLLILSLKRVCSRRIVIPASLLIPALQIVYVYSVSLKSEFIFSLLLAGIITLQVRWLNLLPLSCADYSFLFTAILFPARLFNVTSSLLGNLWIFWILFLTLYTTVKISLSTWKGKHFACCFLFVFLSLSAYSYHLAGIFLSPAFTWIGLSGMRTITTVFVMTFILLSFTFFIKQKFCSRLLRLNRLGKKYGAIEIYFPCFSAIILLLFTLIFVPFSIYMLHNLFIMLLIPCLCLSMLWAQLPFVLLLFRVAFYKDTATFHEWEKEGIASYYRELSGNLTNIHEVRHDIKNIFFTMGSFVERSDDPEMKAFFWEKIYPYSIAAIRQNELLSKLYQIPVESLRAFLNLKLSQAGQLKLTVNLEVHMIPENFQAGIDIIDLTRILGILLDNAIEEVQKIPDGTIDVKITGNENGCSYIIKNSITEETQKSGIHIGATVKGAGRGRGLQIVRQLLDQYHNATLNSFIQELIYIQSLNIDSSNPNRADGAKWPAP